MRSAAATLLILFAGISHSSECLVSGSTVLWTMSYCMSAHETDDEAHPDVSTCFITERSKQDKDMEVSCSNNILYKSAICSLSKERGLVKLSAHECVTSESMIPSIVKNGGV